MPHKTGHGTYKGYESPETTGWPKEIRDHVRKVYGAWREKHPGEDPAIKSRGARIAWASAKRKYPDLYSRHEKLIFETKKEMKEHPWAGEKTAERIAEDHLKKAKKTLDPVVVKPAKTRQSRKRQVADLHSAARRQRRYAATAQHEATSEKKESGKLIKSGRKIEGRDLAQDATLAKEFSGYRKKKAADYDIQAARISYISGD